MPDFMFEFAIGQIVHTIVYSTDTMATAATWWDTEVFAKADEANLVDRLAAFDLPDNAVLAIDTAQISWVRTTPLGTDT